MYDRFTLERFALKAEAMTKQSNKFVAPIRLAELADQLSISKDDARDMADALVEMGWMRNCSVGGDVIITPWGYEQIEKLKQPRWWRWVDQHGPAIIAGTISGAVAGLIVLLIAWLLSR